MSLINRARLNNLIPNCGKIVDGNNLLVILKYSGHNCRLGHNESRDSILWLGHYNFSLQIYKLEQAVDDKVREDS